jgi:hypothetical protein
MAASLPSAFFYLQNIVSLLLVVLQQEITRLHRASGARTRSIAQTSSPVACSSSPGNRRQQFALPAELHDTRPWQDSNLRPSKEPSHIATGDFVLHLIAGEWAMRYRHFCRRRPKSHGAK